MERTVLPFTFEAEWRSVPLERMRSSCGICTGMPVYSYFINLLTGSDPNASNTNNPKKLMNRWLFHKNLFIQNDGDQAGFCA